MRNQALILLTIFSIVLNLSIDLSAQPENNELLIHKNIQEKTTGIYDSLINIRRDLHRNPEVSGEEKRTSKIIENYLTSLGLEVKSNIGGYGVVGILKGKEAGKIIAWRADIDAIKSDVPDVVDFKSNIEGVRHICGHDVHTTIGLGIANVLSSIKDNLDGTIVFIFQPSEENLKGAKSMIDDGLYDYIKPDEIYGLHVNPMPTGLIAAKQNEVYAYMKLLNINLVNFGSNEEISDFIKKISMEFTTVPEESKFWDDRNLGDPQVGIMNPEGVYKKYLVIDKEFKINKNENGITIEMFITGTDESEMKLLPEKVEEFFIDSEFADNLISVEYSLEYPTVNNNAELTQLVLKDISSVYGVQSVLQFYGVIPYRNDDFSYFQEEIPGVYFFLGGSDFQKGIISMPHAPDFAVDENCIKTGVNYFSSMLVDRLKNNNK